VASEPAVVGATAPGQVTTLEPDAIGVTQDTVIGMASSAPAGTLAATLASLTAATAYGGGAVLLLTAVPMLIIANAYRRLNLWNANCGASFEWVGRSINPYLGFMTGWLMVTGYVLTTVAEVVVLAPSVLQVVNSGSTNSWQAIGIDTFLVLVMLIIAVVGIRLTVRVQIAMAAVEYAILMVISAWGLIAEATHHPGTVHISAGWAELSGVAGKGSLAGGLLIAVYIYSAWDGTIYVNEEVRHRRVNPGRAAMWAVGLLAVIYTFAQIGLQGVVSSSRLKANAATALVYAAQALGGGAAGKAMALAVALSVTAATGTGIVLTARIVFGMAGRDVLPKLLANVSPRWATPVPASVLTGVAIIAVIWVYLLATKIATVFADVVAVSGLLFTAFYILTALAMMVYYRRRIITGPRDAIFIGLLPVGAIGLLGWIMVRSMQLAPAAQRNAVYGVVAVGIVVMIVVRVVRRPSFFRIPRESDNPREPQPQAQASGDQTG
jgi:amino acid transporter